MTRSIAVVALVASMLPVSPALAEIEICSPGAVPSMVAEDGKLIEPWGTVGLRIIEPKQAKVAEHRVEEAPMPVAVTCTKSGPIALTQSAYRAPVWPSGVDVLEAELVNTGSESAQVALELAVPETMQIGETTGSVRGQPSLLLPDNLEAIREAREWGYVDGVSALPGWAKPSVPCDLAYKNISAGMGGVPIRYRFRVEPGSKRTVMLGFCESHHPSAGMRPLLIQVEGVEDRSIDPIAAWGQHVPGVLRFDAVDADANGRLEVTVAPHPQARDRNPILNVLWVFDPKVRIDEANVITGGLNEQAEHYVDVGGTNDQSLYKPGNLRFGLSLQPAERREFLFVLRSPGCRYLPDMSQGLWDRASLRKAAADVWRDRWDESSVAEGPSSEPK